MVEQTVHGRGTYDLEAPYVDKMATNPYLKAGELFSGTTG